MTRPQLAVALAMTTTKRGAHRLTEQSGPEMMVPGRKTTKFDDSGGTKSQACLEIGPAEAPG
jgi:hypothetical protein